MDTQGMQSVLKLAKQNKTKPALEASIKQKSPSGL